MAPTIIPRVASGNQVRQLLSYASRAFSRLSIRDAASSATPLASVFALVLTSSSSVSRRAITSIADLSSSRSTTIAVRSADLLPHPEHAHLLKRQNVILCIPTTYAGLNSGPSPGVVVGVMLGSIVGVFLIMYVWLLSVQFWTGRGTTTIKEEIIIDKRRSHSSKKSRRSSHRSGAAVSERVTERISVHESPIREEEMIVEVEEEYIRRPSHRPSPSPEPEEVIVEEEETISDEIVEVIEEQSSIVSPSPPPRKPSSSGRRSGFRIVDPADFGGGDAPMRRMSSRRSSGRGS